MSRFLTLVNGVKTWATAISASAGAADADKLIRTGATGKIDGSLLPAGDGISLATFYEYKQFVALTPLEFVHGLGGVPNIIQAHLYCHTNDVFWPVGWYQPMVLPWDYGGTHHVALNYGTSGDRVIIHHFSGSSIALKRTDANGHAYITPSRWGIDCLCSRIL